MYRQQEICRGRCVRPIDAAGSIPIVRGKQMSDRVPEMTGRLATTAAGVR